MMLRRSRTMAEIIPDFASLHPGYNGCASWWAVASAFSDRVACLSSAREDAMQIGLLTTAICAAAVWAAASSGASAAEVKVLSTTGMREAIEDLAPKFERSTGHKAVAAFANSGTTLRRLAEGEAADIIILPRDMIEGLVKDGKANANSVATVARVGLGIAIRKGAAKPDIATPEGFK